VYEGIPHLMQTFRVWFFVSPEGVWTLREVYQNIYQVPESVSPPAINQTDAEATARETVKHFYHHKQGIESSIIKALTIKMDKPTQRAFVYRNDFFSLGDSSESVELEMEGKTHCCWVVQLSVLPPVLPKMPPPVAFVWSIWVDSATGEVVGGKKVREDWPDGHSVVYD